MAAVTSRKTSVARSGLQARHTSSRCANSVSPGCSRVRAISRAPCCAGEDSAGMSGSPCSPTFSLPRLTCDSCV
eukprot:4499095-Pyramimonas_sp.AAC.1